MMEAQYCIGVRILNSETSRSDTDVFAVSPVLRVGGVSEC